MIGNPIDDAGPWKVYVFVRQRVVYEVLADINMLKKQNSECTLPLLSVDEPPLLVDLYHM